MKNASHQQKLRLPRVCIVNYYSEENELNRINEDEFYSDLGWDYRESWDAYLNSEFGTAIRKAIEAIANMPSEANKETIGFLVDMAGEDGFDFKHNFYEILEVLNKKPDYASENLMKLIASEENAVVKTLATRSLYHLELGKIGMSEEGVNYLGKTFDLGQKNNPNYFANRAIQID